MIIGGYPRPSALLRFGVGLSRAPLRCGAAHSSRWSLPSYPLANPDAPPTHRLQRHQSPAFAAHQPAPGRASGPPNHRSGPGRRSTPSLPCSAGARAAFFRPNPCSAASAPPLPGAPALSPPHRISVAPGPAAITSRTAAPPRRDPKAPRRASAPPRAGAGRRLKKPAARVVKLAFRPRRHRSKARCAARPLASLSFGWGGPQAPVTCSASLYIASGSAAKKSRSTLIRPAPRRAAGYALPWWPLPPDPRQHVAF